MIPRRCPTCQRLIDESEPLSPGPPVRLLRSVPMRDSDESTLDGTVPATWSRHVPS